MPWIRKAFDINSHHFKENKKKTLLWNKSFVSFKTNDVLITFIKHKLLTINLQVELQILKMQQET